ncbi:MAG TPA: roadblock/LC7 domain-containing protein [Ilumatobacteraceae bacterium]|nr:roadblock/LC7 domain-containing protein [Ilumatobacteraceae bacterium]
MEKVKAVADVKRLYMTAGMPPRPSTASASTWTAPTRSGSTLPPAPPTHHSPLAPPPPAAPGAPTSPTAPTADAAAILDELVDAVEGVRSAILASVDGFGLARSSSMSEEASHPAMLAAAIGLAHQLVVMGGGTQLRQLVVDHDGGLMLIWPIGDQRVLAVLATSTVEQRRVRAFVQASAGWLAGAAT